MEILSEKAERMQAKKELEIMKEIEERVKKDIKVSLNTKSGLNPTTQPTNSYTIIQGNQNNTNPSQFAHKTESKNPSKSEEEMNNMGIKKLPSIVTE